MTRTKRNTFDNRSTPTVRRKLSSVAHPWAAFKGDFETSPSRSFGEVSNAILVALRSGKAGDSEDGTPLAIKYPTNSVSVDSTRRSRRGGAHNSAARQSNGLNRAQVANIIAARAYSDRIGLPFTRMITVHWEAAGVPLEGMTKATSRFIDLLNKTITRHGFRTAWVWVHENGDGKGGHCHLLAHVPVELVPKVSRLQQRWLRNITGQPYKKGVILSRPIGRRLGLEQSNPALHAANSLAVLRYVLKQTTVRIAAEFGLDRLEPGGQVIGKRCGTSQNIGAKARALAGFNLSD